jgi:hypothetical protein
MPLYSSWIHGVTARQGVADPAAAGGLAGAVDLHTVAQNSMEPTLSNPASVYCAKRFTRKRCGLRDKLRRKGVSDLSSKTRTGRGRGLPPRPSTPQLPGWEAAGARLRRLLKNPRMPRCCQFFRKIAGSQAPA